MSEMPLASPDLPHDLVTDLYDIRVRIVRIRGYAKEALTDGCGYGRRNQYRDAIRRELNTINQLIFKHLQLPLI